MSCWRKQDRMLIRHGLREYREDRNPRDRLQNEGFAAHTIHSATTLTCIAHLMQTIHTPSTSARKQPRRVAYVPVHTHKAEAAAVNALHEHASTFSRDGGQHLRVDIFHDALGSPDHIRERTHLQLAVHRHTIHHYLKRPTTTHSARDGGRREFLLQDLPEFFILRIIASRSAVLHGHLDRAGQRPLAC